jgi:hypothetical protein
LNTEKWPCVSFSSPGNSCFSSRDPTNLSAIIARLFNKHQQDRLLRSPAPALISYLLSLISYLHCCSRIAAEDRSGAGEDTKSNKPKLIATISKRHRAIPDTAQNGSRIKKPAVFLAKTLPAEDPGFLAKGAVFEAIANLRHPFAPPAGGRLRFEAAILCEASESNADNAHQAEQKKGRQNKASAVPSPETATPPGRSGSGVRMRIGPVGREAVGQSAPTQKASDGRCNKSWSFPTF